MAVSTQPERLGTRAIAIAGMCLAIATVSRLRAKGDLIDSDIYQIFEEALVPLHRGYDSFIGPGQQLLWGKRGPFWNGLSQL
jgi:hypothetical protein